jgi:hypothetical protein
VSDFAAYLAAAVLLGFGAYRFVADRRRTAAYPARAAIYGFLVSLGLAMALLATGVSNLLVRLGAGALAVVLAGEIVRTAAVGFLMQIGRLLLPAARPTRARGAALVVPAALAVQAAMIGTFLAARPRATPDWSLEVTGDGRLLLSAHDAIFALYSIWVLLELVNALRRESLRVGPGPLRLGTQLMLAAACVGILWAAWTADDIADVLRSSAQSGTEDTVSNTLGAVCASLVVAGATVTRWGEALAAPLRWYRAYRTYAALGPLWKALHAQIPEIALAERPGRFGAALPSDLAFALYRRVIEIHDGRLALRPYTPTKAAVAALIRAARTDRSPLAQEPDPAALIKDAQGEDAQGEDVQPEDAMIDDALIEAVSIAAALANLHRGRKVETDEGAPAAGDPHERGSVEAEAAWLVEVTGQFTRSPLVPRALGRLDGLDGVDGLDAPTR